MPNGKPGDHPYTDIVVHGTDILEHGLDDIVREISRDFPEKREALSSLLWDNTPPYGQKLTQDQVVALREGLVALQVRKRNGQL